MELFSEIYNRYYFIIEGLLQRPSWSHREAKEYIRLHGFGETLSYLWPILTNPDFTLFSNDEEAKTLTTRIRTPWRRPPTKLMWQWLALAGQLEESYSISSTPLFKDMKATLDTVPPLTSLHAFIYPDRCLLPDAYQSPNFQKAFSILIEALQKKHPVQIRYLSRGGRILTGIYFVEKLWYSLQRESFQVTLFRTSGSKKPRQKSKQTFLLRNIQDLEIVTDAKVSPPLTASVNYQTATLRISCERNTMERFLLHFSGYKKRTVYNDAEKSAITELTYDAAEEATLLMNLLAFGPTIEVLAPACLRKQIKLRIMRQSLLSMPLRRSLYSKKRG